MSQAGNRLFTLGGVLLGGAITATIGLIVQRSANSAQAATNARVVTFELLRWAADKVTSAEDDEVLIAVAVLGALVDSKPELLQLEDEGIVRAVLGVVTERPKEEYDAYPDAEIELLEGTNEP